ncbi:hypothetical protein EYR41_002886 [Orbilia oligospora]|uniref:Protein kinase domain-containing protein n=1 Tax=Orbilia oligospora TaxID=2813651 RepID=A0A8H2E7K9_ORBOL|nr:hypothetical protein EYR41_002886 [Orbilia oligospora]
MAIMATFKLHRYVIVQVYYRIPPSAPFHHLIPQNITIAMTTVEEALALTLPKILNRYARGTRYSASSQKDFIDRKFIYYWKDFEVDVIHSLEKSDLTGELNFADPPEGELILVGTEHGLTGRFQENVGALLGRAFNISTDNKINRLRFGDSYVVTNGGGGQADILIMMHPLSESDDITCRVVGDMKPFWTKPGIKSAKPSRITEADDPAADAMRRAPLGLDCLEPILGQLTRYMVHRNVKYGFLSTYEHTIFVKRAGRARFEITDPIIFNNTNPTIRQCFFHMGILGSSDDYLYIDRDPEGTLQALRSGKYDGEEDKEEDLSSSSRNLRRKKRDAPEDEDDDIDEERIEAGPSKKPRTKAATVGPSEIGALTKDKANPRKAFLPREMEVEAENSLPAFDLNIKTALRNNRKNRSGKTPQKQALEKVTLVTEPPSSLKEQPSETYQVKDVTVHSVFFGEDGISKHLFQIQNTVQQNPDKKKRVFIGLYNGTECIAKYFPAEDVERYTDERNNYRFLPFSRHFPKMLAFGDVIVSAELGRGHIIILTKEKGIPLDYQMIEEMSQEERDLIRQEVISAVSILRSIGARHGDPAPWNILWDRDSERVVMLDFENMRKEYKEVPADVGEVDRILGSKPTL